MLQLKDISMIINLPEKDFLYFSEEYDNLQLFSEMNIDNYQIIRYLRGCVITNRLNDQYFYVPDSAKSILDVNFSELHCDMELYNTMF